MTFLKRIGRIIQTGAELFLGFAPLLTASMPQASGAVQVVSRDLSELLTIIAQAEAAGASLGLAGPDKLRIAAPQLLQVLLSSAVLAGKPIQNPSLALQGATKVGDGLADLLNAVHPEAVQAVTVPTQPPPA